MTTATLVRPAPAEASEAVALVRAAHDEFVDVVAGLDLDDRAVWAAADRSVARVSAEAYAMASALTGDRWAVAQPGVPPVVRIRELSVAQRRMFAALDASASGASTELFVALKRSASRVTESARWLGIVTAVAET